MAAIAMQERHLYRMLRDQMEAIGKLRIARHDAKNELLVLRAFWSGGTPTPPAPTWPSCSAGRDP